MSSVFDDLMLSAQQAVDISHGKLEPARVTKMPIPDVKGIRKRAGFKQSDFAKLIGVSCSLVEAWEQHKRTPTGSSLKLLMLLDKNPDTINQLSTM